MRIKAVVFDIDDTLLSGRRPVFDAAMEGIRAAHSALASAGVPMPDFRTTFAMVHNEMTRAAAGMSFGNYRESSIPDLARGFLSRAFPGLPDAAVGAALDAWYAPLGQGVVAAEGAFETLSELRSRGIALAAAGNSPWGAKYVSRDLEAAGLLRLIDSVTCSADVGFRKPNLFLISRALESVGAHARAAVHVGDDPREDVEAPQELGMIAVLLGRRGAPSRADIVIPGLELLPAEIDRLDAKT